MRNALFALLITSFALSGCVVRQQRLDQAPRRTSLSADRVELPALFTKGRPYVDLKINGKGPYHFLVDTGSQGTSITSQVAREAGISAAKNFTANVTGASGQAEALLMGIVDRIESPGFSLRVVAVTILTPQSVALLDMHGNQPSGGIIGMSALQNVRLEIDFPQRKVSVARLDSAAPSAERGIPYTGLSPHVTVTTPAEKHATAMVVIDTGSDGGWEFAAIENYPVRVGLAKNDGYSSGIGGYWRPLFGQLNGDVRLGPATWRDPMIFEANENRLGGEALATWKLVIDQSKKVLWLMDDEQVTTTNWTGPLEPDGRPAVYGFVSVPEGDGFVVKEVDSGGRADRAGLKVGDHYRWERGDPVPSGQSRAKNPYQFQLHVARGSEKIEINLSLLEPLPAATEPAAAAREAKAAGARD